MNQERVTHLKKLSKLMDSQFEGPLGFKFGLDGILGFIPVVGDLTTTAASIYIIAHAAELGCSTSTLIRMALNVIVENIFDMFPFLGNIADFFWRSNDRNLLLLEKSLLNPQATSKQSSLIVAAIVLFILMSLIGSAYVAFQVLKMIVIHLQSTGS